MDPPPAETRQLALVQSELVAMINTLATAVLASPVHPGQHTAACDLLQGIAEDLKTTIEECEWLRRVLSGDSPRPP